MDVENYGHDILTENNMHKATRYNFKPFAVLLTES